MVDADPNTLTKDGKAALMLLDAFEVSGRGAFAVVGNLDGTIQIGDVAVLPQGRFPVGDVQGLRFSAAKNWPKDAVAVAFDGADLSALRDLIGQRIFVVEGAD